MLTCRLALWFLLMCSVRDAVLSSLGRHFSASALLTWGLLTFVMGPVPCIAGRVTASRVPAHQHRSHPSPQPNCLRTMSKVPWGTALPPIENHGPRAVREKATECHGGQQLHQAAFSASCPPSALHGRLHRREYTGPQVTWLLLSLTPWQGEQAIPESLAKACFPELFRYHVPYQFTSQQETDVALNPSNLTAV